MTYRDNASALTAFTASPADRSTGFEPVQGGSDTVSAEGLLVAAYIIMWAILLAFVLIGWRRQQRLSQRISDLEAALDKAEGAAAREAP